MRRRRRALVVALAALVAVSVTLIVTLAGGRGSRVPRAESARRSTSTPVRTHARSTAPAAFAVGLRTVRVRDPTRQLELPSGAREPRTLLTYVRYPATGPAGATDVPNAPPAAAGGPFPLVVFGHGFAVTPGLYKRLLQGWARAGYVVAAPVFPLENANAPGGPDESDLINQPADMRLVISRLLAASDADSGPFAGVIDASKVAVSGQSDGGDTALAVAYSHNFRDPRVRAAVILSGAEMPGASGFSFSAGAPPLLAVQGTADAVNPPALTETFFQAARPPKFLLVLPGAEHLAPYSEQEPQLGIVERATIAFLDAYLKHRSGALERLRKLGNVPGEAALNAEP